MVVVHCFRQPPHAAAAAAAATATISITITITIIIIIIVVAVPALVGFATEVVVVGSNKQNTTSS